jgi:penicillin amidase
LVSEESKLPRATFKKKRHRKNRINRLKQINSNIPSPVTPFHTTMRILRFLLALAATSLAIWQMGRPQAAGDKTLPPLGTFFNPFSGFWANAEPIAPPTFKNAALPGLQGKVEVVYDDLLVPHIFAENREDAARVQGYITAQHRLWQMDLTTRKAAGRLSEILGERTLRLDRLARRRGMTFAAENDLVGWRKSPSTMRLIEAYTEGVNAWVAQLDPADYPIEFKLLDYAPEPWSPLKTALVTEAMAEMLCMREDDLASTNALEHFGRETFDYLYPEWNPKQQPIVLDTGQCKTWKPVLPPPFAASSTSRLGYAPTGAPATSDWSEARTPLTDGPFVGSNNWAVSGLKSKSGKPLLANDPHLTLSLPAIWYQVQIHTPKANTYGVSLPGLPGVVVGFNDDIAWGVTNVGHDVSDWYTIDWVDNERKSYRLDGEQRSVQFRYEEIGVKGKPTLRDTVRYTVFGPVTYDFEPENALRNCAFRWAAHDVPELSAFDVFIGLNEGKTYEDYKSTLVGYDAPAQNFVFASRSGDIAIQVQGKFPVRGRERGRFLQDGSRWGSAWHTFVPWEQVPSMKNPARGFVFSANQHSTPPSYPYYYLGGFEDWRSRRIHDRLAAMQGATADSMKSVQLDNFSQRAADGLPAMLRLLDRSKLDADGQQMADELSRWDFRYEADLLAPTLFEAWFDSCYYATWDEIAVLEKQKKDILWPDGWRFVEMLETDTASVFFDHPATPARETARDIALESFRLMQNYFKQNPQKRVGWGESRGFVLKHLAQLDAFSRLDLKVGGHRSAPNAMQRTHGPSWRMIVELGDPVRAQGVYPGGQSGNPGSRYYDNMAEAWAKGEYYDLLFLQAPAEGGERVLGRQVFSPK